MSLIGLIQRVSRAAVHVAGALVGEIDAGLLALIGVQRADTEENARELVRRIINYRVFDDKAGKMNINLTTIKGGLLLVPQFTLAADTRHGLRPGFSTAAPPEIGRRLFDEVLKTAIAAHPHVESGRFGADMQVSLINDGPVTFWLES